MTRLPPLLCLLLACLLPAPEAMALGLPLPSLPRPAGGLVEPALADGSRLAGDRLRRVRSLLRTHPRELARDPRGEPIVRAQLLAIDPQARSLAVAEALGLRVSERRRLEPLGLELVVLEAPPRRSLRRLLQQLREADPEGHFDYNHVYLGAGPTAQAAGEEAPAAGGAPAGRVGLVDGAVSPSAPARLHRHGCPDAPADAHGTAVARLLLEQPGLEVFAADVYCGQATGGSVSRLAGALAWLAGEHVAVINLSLVGPDNALLRRLVESMQARGHVLVAAVGNEGPAAAPLYPAAYPGVIGVAAVDGRGRVLPESGRGEHVDFAALGLYEGTDAQGRPVRLRGTSFAAPRVARRAALALPRPASGAQQRVFAALAAEAMDAPPAGRDRKHGEGVIGD